MGAFGAAISGLQSSEQWLGVISNNVANSETVGFKAGELNFATLISQDLSAPSGDDSEQNLGGVDAMQVGLGVTVGDIATDLQQGSIETTGNVTDIAIEGQGYLTVKDGDQTLYTRAGNLTFDSNGDLVTADGGLVQGWSLTENIQPTAPAGAGGIAGPTAMTLISTTLNTSNTSDINDIVVPNNLQIAPMASEASLIPGDEDAAGVTLAGNLDSYTLPTEYNDVTAAGYAGGAPTTAAIAQAIGQDADATSNFTVYDSLGTPYNFTVYWYQTNDTENPGAAAAWNYVVFNTTGGAVPNDTSTALEPGGYVLNGGGPGTAWAAGNAANTDTTWVDSVTFNNDGSLATNGGNVLTENPTITLDTNDGSLEPFTFSVDLGTPNLPATATAPAQWGKSNGLTGAYGGGTTDPTTGVYTPLQSIYTKSTTGYEKGTLTGLSFNETGGIEATFSNGQTIVIAQLALSNFVNPGGLESDGGNYFTATDNSGGVQIGTAGSNGFGTIDGGALEESNVDLSTELTNMILAQTMYQANSKVITTQANLYEDLFNAIPQQ